MNKNVFEKYHVWGTYGYVTDRGDGQKWVLQWSMRKSLENLSLKIVVCILFTYTIISKRTERVNFSCWHKYVLRYGGGGRSVKNSRDVKNVTLFWNISMISNSLLREMFFFERCLFRNVMAIGIWASRYLQELPRDWCEVLHSYIHKEKNFKKAILLLYHSFVFLLSYFRLLFHYHYFLNEYGTHTIWKILHTFFFLNNSEIKSYQVILFQPSAVPVQLLSEFSVS